MLSYLIKCTELCPFWSGGGGDEIDTHSFYRNGRIRDKKVLKNSIKNIRNIIKTGKA